MFTERQPQTLADVAPRLAAAIAGRPVPPPRPRGRQPATIDLRRLAACTPPNGQRPARITLRPVPVRVRVEDVT
jgi:hypothetical protein